MKAIERTKQNRLLIATAWLLAAGAVVAALGPAVVRGETNSLSEAKTVGGVTVYLGVVPAQIILGEYAKGSPERKMHKGVPRSRNAHHVMVALFDAQSGKRITDAKVTATVRQLGLGGPTKQLTAMTISGATTYGNFFSMPNGVRYRIEITVRTPETHKPVKAEFDYEHMPD